MFTDARDATGLTMLTQGVNPEKATIDQVLKAVDKIDEANRKGQFRRFTGNDYTQDLTNGNVWWRWPTRATSGSSRRTTPTSSS